MICSSCSITVSLSPLGLYISSLPVSHSSCHCLYVAFCLSGSACEGLQKGCEQWLVINSQHLASHEITGWILRVLNSICVINSIFGKMAGNVIIGEEMNAANLFENLNRIWQTEMWNLGEETERFKKKRKNCVMQSHLRKDVLFHLKKEASHFKLAFKKLPSSERQKNFTIQINKKNVLKP